VNATGESLAAKVEFFKIKNMQAQSNGVIEISFTDGKGTSHQKKMTLPVQQAAQLQQMAIIPIRFKADSFVPVVFVPTYELQKNVIQMNLGIILLSFVLTVWAGLRINTFVFKKSSRELQNDELERAWNELEKNPS
jgi:hypothetical protein